MLAEYDCDRFYSTSSDIAFYFSRTAILATMVIKAISTRLKHLPLTVKIYAYPR